MRDYGKVTPQFWIGSTGKRLRGDPNAQVVALYLMTGPHSEWTGVFHCPALYIAHETGVGLEGALKALARLSEVGFCMYDEASEVVFVLNMAKFQIGDKLKPADNRVAGIRNDYRKMPQGPIKQRFFEIYGAPFCLQNEDEKGSPFEAPLKPLRSQEQEQEQEKEQEKEKEPPKPPAAVAASSGKPDPARELLAYLNAKTGKHFRNVPASLDPIRARLKSATADEVRAVIDDRVRAWASDPEMAKYLRPETLFRASKFEGYLGNIGAVGKGATLGNTFNGIRVEEAA